MRIWVCVLWLGIFPYTAILEAQEPPSSVHGEESEVHADESEELPVVQETIVVTATRSERGLDDVPMSITVIDEAEIQASPAPTVDDLLRTVPGLHMPLSSSLVTQPSGQRFSMRGLGGSRALVLLDGVPIHDPYHGTIEWDKIPLDSIEQIEIVRGGNASLFGNYALGGTVNVITRPIDSRSIDLHLARGSFDTNLAAMSVDYPVNPRLGLRLSHHRLDSDGYYHAVEPGPADIPVWAETRVTTVRADLVASPRTRGQVKLDWSEAGTGDGRPLTLIDHEVFDVAASLRRAVGAQGLASFTLFHKDVDSRDITSAYTEDGQSSYLTDDSNIPATVTGGSIEWSAGRDGVLSFLSAGIDVQQLDVEEFVRSFARDGSLAEEQIVRGHQEFAGAFGQASWTPDPRIEILTSARIDYYRNADGFESVLGGSTTVFPETSTTELSPRISARYELDEGSALRGAVYRAFNAPKLRELYRNSNPGNTIILGNPHLQPETLVGGEVGWDRTIPRGRFMINLYWSEIEGIVIRGPVEGQPSNVIQYANLGDARSRGIELMTDFRISPSWKAVLGYTWADSTIVSSPADRSLEGNLVPEVAPHTGTLDLRYHSFNGFAANLRWRVLSDSYGEPENLRPAPGHQVLDLGVSSPITDWMDAYIDVNNALDEKYFFVLSARTDRATEPRNIAGGVRIRVPERFFGGSP